METNGMRVAYATDPTYYTAMYRAKGSRRYYRCGYRSLSLGDIRDMVYSDIRNGKYAAAKIVRWDTEELIEKVI